MCVELTKICSKITRCANKITPYKNEITRYVKCTKLLRTVGATVPVAIKRIFSKKKGNKNKSPAQAVELTV